MTATEQASFTCPRCRMTSHHPDDLKYGYCGNCHAFTGRDVWTMLDLDDIERRAETGDVDRADVRALVADVRRKLAALAAAENERDRLHEALRRIRTLAALDGGLAALDDGLAALDDGR